MVLAAQQRRWRYRTFVLTWLAYAGFYLCRKNFSVVMPLLADDLGYSKLQLATVIWFYSLFYALGQFSNGPLADRLGPRLIVGVGLGVAILSNVAMGFAASLLLFSVLSSANGLGQSTGWPGLVKQMAAWFRRRERGVVMAWWGTCYVLGGAFATIFATYWAVHPSLLAAWGWRRGFWMPAFLLAFVAFAYVLLTRNNPTDAGVPEIVDGDAPDIIGADAPELVDGDRRDLIGGDRADPIGSRSSDRRQSTGVILRAVLSEPAVWVIAVMYFFLKMTRYSFLYWLPLYMTEHLGYGVAEAGYTSALYELVGFTGAISAGYASDKLFGSRRFPVGALMLWGLALVCFLQPVLVGWGRAWVAVWIALVGIMTFGPDTLMTGAAAQDYGGREGSGTAAGFINGVGSLGQLCSPFLVAYVVDAYGWDSLFYLFVIFALIGGTLLATRWNSLPAPAGPPEGGAT